MGIKTKTSFKPGQSGNPSGQPKLPAELVALRRTTTHESDQVMFQTLQLSGEKTREILDDQTRPNLERLWASITQGAIEGDHKMADLLLTRAFGKPKEVLDVHTNPISSLSDEEKLEKAKLAVQILSQRLKANG